MGKTAKLKKDLAAEKAKNKPKPKKAPLETFFNSQADIDDCAKKNHKVWIRSNEGMFLDVPDRGDDAGLTMEKTMEQAWFIEDAGGGKFYLKHVNGLYLEEAPGDFWG